MKKAIVSGATSFLGFRLINRLLGEGYEVFALVRPNTTKRKLLNTHPMLSIIEMDLSDYHNLDKVINKEIDVFFSFAWNGTRGVDRDNYDLQKFNYACSIAGLKSALNLGCKKVITAGSQAEYGLYNHKISEDTEERPITQYGKFKLQFYLDSKEFCLSRGVKIIEPRFFSVYGPGDFDDTMVISTLRQMIAHKPCLLTEGIQMWDFLYVSDAIDAVLHLTHSDCRNGVYNLGSGIAKPLREYIYEMRSLTSSKSDLLFGAIPYPSTGMVSIEPDISKIIKETGWYPKVTFETGIKQVIESLNHEDH